METAIFAAGCFWGVEEAFHQQKGVRNTEVGYTGGTTEDPTYEQVCTGTTGHAEAVRVQFEPDEINYANLLSIFWSCHDPTQVNGQGPDIGTQYRSAIFVSGNKQEQIARASKEELEDAQGPGHSIATQIVPARAFYRAEEYHQQYFAKRGGGSCQSNSKPS